MSSQRFLGVTVLPEYIQSEGVDGVLDNLVTKVGANAVATSPYLMEEADKETGAREPPADAGAGAVRLLDRPLFGKREVWVRTAPSFVPDPDLYRGLRYQPAEPTALTRSQGQIIHDFIRAAQARHLKVYLQVQAAIPPGYRVQFGGPVDDDRARLPDGRIPPRRLAKNGSLASPHILEYEHALLRDLCKNYPDIDGIRVDWPEYPPYFLDSVFLDFGPHAERVARRLGFDFDLMQREVGGLYEKLHGGLTDADLAPWTEADGGRFSLLRLMTEYPGVGQWLKFKAQLVEQMLAGFARSWTIPAGSTGVNAQRFPAPFYRRFRAGFCFGRKTQRRHQRQALPMHWPMILRFYGDQILKANPGLSSQALVRALVKWLDIADDDGLPQLEDYNYPPPDAPHPVGPKAQARKIRQAQAQAGDTPIYVLAHGYGPIDDFRKRIEVAHKAGKHGMWVNRYAYLTDEKLEAIGQVTGA